MTFEPSQALTRQLPRMGELLPRRQTFRLLHKARPSGELAAPQAMPERVFLLRFDQPPQLQRVDALIRYLLRRKALIDGKGIEVQLRAVGA